MDAITRAPKPIASSASALRLYRTEGGVTRSYALTASVTFPGRTLQTVHCGIRARSWDYPGSHLTDLGVTRLGPGGRTEIR